MYDYLIVGAGVYGATFARVATDAGKRCLVIDKRDHIAGNCFDERREGVLVNRYGGHIFHTNSKPIWEFINRFAEFSSYQHRVKASYQGEIFSFPINLNTFNEVCGKRTPDEAEKWLERQKWMGLDPRNFQEQCLSTVGSRLYEMFFYGYTKKQWGREPRELPASIAKRIPIRLTYDDRYFSDTYQGMPTEGYTEMVWRMLDKIEVKLGIDATFDNLEQLAHCITGQRVVYSGPLDALFDYRFGNLEYRSLRFEHETHEGDYQGAATINYTDESVPFTRIIEWKHFRPEDHQGTGTTVTTREYPSASGEPYYPVADETNRALYEQYRALVPDWMVVGGRLGRYRYLNMDQAVGMAMSDFRREISA